MVEGGSGWVGGSGWFRGRDRLWPPFLAIVVLTNPILTNPILANPISANLFLDLVCVMAPKGGAQPQRKSGPKGEEAQNFVFLFRLPPPISLFLSLIVWPGPSNVHVWSSRVVV